MFDVLNDEQIKEVMAKNFIGRLGCHALGKTYVVPISYAYDGENIYARTFEGMKLDLMRKNPEVCFQVDSMVDMNDWKSVIIWGRAEELADKTEREKGLNILLTRELPNVSSETVKLSPEWPFPPTDCSKIEGIIFRINISEITGRCERPNPDEHRK